MCLRVCAICCRVSVAPRRTPNPPTAHFGVVRSGQRARLRSKFVSCARGGGGDRACCLSCSPCACRFVRVREQEVFGGGGGGICGATGATADTKTQRRPSGVISRISVARLHGWRATCARRREVRACMRACVCVCGDRARACVRPPACVGLVYKRQRLHGRLSLIASRRSGKHLLRRTRVLVCSCVRACVIFVCVHV